jgi:4-aminobutyrate aminotransferase-like enzyme
VGLATLRVIQNERLMEHVQVQSKFLFEKLSELKRFEFVGDVRGIGFYLGVDLVVDKQSRKPAKELAVYVIEQLRVRYRILISTDGPFDNVLKIKPPLVFSHCNAKFLVSSLEETFQELAIRFYAVHQDLITGLTAQ